MDLLVDGSDARALCDVELPDGYIIMREDDFDDLWKLLDQIEETGPNEAQALLDKLDTFQGTLEVVNAEGVRGWRMTGC